MVCVCFVEVHGGLVSAGYGDDDAGRAEDGEERDSGNEESDENEGNSVSVFAHGPDVYSCTRLIRHVT